MSTRKKKSLSPPPDFSFRERWRAWYAGKSPALWFCVRFIVLTLIYFAISLTPKFNRLLDGYLAVNARAASSIVNFVGETSHVTEATIWSAEHAITVLPPCSALELAWFFCAVVLSFPAPIESRVYGLFTGIPILFLLNLARIVSLYYVSVHFAGFFDTLHETIWPILLVVATILVCAEWIRRAIARSQIQPDGAA